MELMKQKRVKGFGQRLAEIRKSRGLSLRELGERVGASKRVMIYYESEDAQPPGGLLVDLARVLRVSTDELLGLKPVKEKLPPRSGRLLKRLELIEKLPPADQRAVIKFLDAFLNSRLALTPAEREEERTIAPLRKVAGKR